MFSHKNIKNKCRNCFRFSGIFCNLCDIKECKDCSKLSGNIIRMCKKCNFSLCDKHTKNFNFANNCNHVF